MESGFVHLHLHSEYSLLDGAVRVADIPRLAKEAGHTAVALTDHGNMYGAVAFYRACRAEGIQPIIGCEVYVAPKSRFVKVADKESNYYHLVLLVENAQGYQNLIAMVSRSYMEGFYGKPRIDLELLSQYKEGLICLTGCLGGYIPTLLSRGDYDGALSYARELCAIFGEDHLYLEMQDHGLALQKSVNRDLRRISAETGIGLVATNDVHYPRRTDADTQAIMMCIQTGSVIADGRPLGFETDEYFYKSTEQMRELFYRDEDRDALENTVRIAERCSFDFCFDKLYLPVFETEDGTPPADYLCRLAKDGLQRRIEEGSIVFDEIHPRAEYEERIDYELRTICEMGYAEYYLIVWDFVRYAKQHGIPVGPGRGSGAGSLIAYLIGITDVDSIHFSLMFERFLNPERISMPDFDIDFSDVGRGEVIEYVKRRYGEDHVAQIVTFGTLAARAAVRDVGRALGMPYADCDRIAKLIDHDIHITLDRAMETSEELRTLYDSDTAVRRLIDTAKALEGMPRHASTHAAGVVITDRPVHEYVPLAENSGMAVTQFDMDTVAALGLLKIDFLGLRYLTVISDTEAQIREQDPAFSAATIPLDDRATYEMIGAGKTAGVFQLESGGMRAMLTQLAPDNIEMIVAAISLYRPGPMDSIPKFLENRKHPEKVTYPHPSLRDILDVTFGCIVYQEQVMQICRVAAGYSYARADLVRRAMSKKKTDVMERERTAFIFGQKDDDGRVINVGAVANGIDEMTAGALFDDMSAFAKYAFNKSHASAYAFTSYRTAYLKCHYPAEYISALLTSVSGNQNKTAEYIAEAQRLHISILAPDINESEKHFHAAVVNGRPSIRFGLLAVKNVGVTFVDAILKERARRKFSDFEDFVARMTEHECSKRQVEALIKCGAFDALPQKRSQLCVSYEKIVAQYAERAKIVVTGQMDLFSAFSVEAASGSIEGQAPKRYDYMDIPELSLRDKLLFEREATGHCFSGHLLDDFRLHLQQLSPDEISDILVSFEDGVSSGLFADKQQVRIAGIVSGIVAKVTKKGDTMAFVTLEDRYASMEVIVFPKVLEKCRGYLTQDTALFVIGELSCREEEAPKVLARDILPLHTDTAFRARAEAEGGGSAVPSPSAKASARAAQHTGVSVPAGAKTLYLRVPRIDDGNILYAKAENLVEIFSVNGSMGMPGVSVVFFDEEKREYRRYNGGAVMLTPYILHEFESLLGAENAILR
ncbi:MAG: DNA polymerase III subunit alpha [Clostridia bacterium]|nr:DNA polymerase III subunit alpha [Clostridia bacterium]